MDGKFAGLTARDYYPNFTQMATPDQTVPEAADQQAVNVAESVTAVPNAMSIWVGLGVFAALAVLMHLK